MDIQIKEIGTMKTKVVGLTPKGKSFLSGKRTEFVGSYCWNNANDVGYEAETIGMGVKWIA